MVIRYQLLTGTRESSLHAPAVPGQEKSGAFLQGITAAGVIGRSAVQAG